MKQRKITHPTTGKTFCFGRHRHTTPGARPKRCAKLIDHLPLPLGPAEADYSPAAMASIHEMFGNDQYGDCVIAARYHQKGVHTGNAGALFIPTMDQILADYSAIGGYVIGEAPGGPSDQGCDEVTAINYWTETGDCTGNKLVGAVEIDATNWGEVQSGLWLFEGALVCLECPGSVTSNMPSGDDFVWDLSSDSTAAAPNPDDGHGIQLAGYGICPATGKVAARGVTWGMEGWATPEFCAEYFAKKNGGSFYIILSPDQLAKAQDKCPNGVAWTDLQADMASA
jgi:hypothetical protein